MAVELGVTADLYGLARLQRLCEVHVKRSLTVDSAAGLLLAAHEAHAMRMKLAVMRFALEHFDEVIKSDGFEALPRELILEVLKAK